MKRFWLLISYIVFLLLFLSNLNAQIDDSIDNLSECGGHFYNPCTSYEEEMLDSRYGYELSPHDTIRVLAIFVEMEYSDTIKDPFLHGSKYWSVGALPIWADSLFAAYDTTDFSYKRVTRYYQYASSNDHIVLGDYLLAPDNGGIFKVSTVSGSADLSNIVQVVNQKLNTSIVTANGLSSFSQFDKWTPTTRGYEKPNNPNGKWDYIVFVIRNSLNPNNPNGVTASGGLRYLLGHRIDKASIVCAGNTSNPTHVIRHEYAHMLLGYDDFHTCGGGWAEHNNYWIPQTGGWALLGLYGSSLMCWNAWDRYRLGWRGTNNAYDISARSSNGITEVNGDINGINGYAEYVLRDFVTTGDALRIKLPYIDGDKEYPEWIWLENHQGVNNNNIEFDQWQYQDKTCVQDFVPGLMAYIQINSDIRVSNNQSEVYNQHADYLNPLTANGLWDRRFLTDSINNGCVNNARIRPFLRFKENPLTGCGDQSFYAIDLDGNDSLYSIPNKANKHDQVSNWTEIYGNDTLRNLFQLGHSSHSFNLSGNKKIGISTNPSSAPLINMVGQRFQLTSAKNLRKTYLNGISIEIIEQNATNGNIKVRVRYDDVDVENDVRWCSDSIVLNNIQTNSGYSLNVKQGKTILLDQGLNATRMTNPIMFNGQKIFASPTTFIVQPDVKIHLESAAKIVLDNSSKLHLREGASCIVEDNGDIEVKDGTVLQLDDCSSIVINGMGKLIVRSGAELRISPEATLAFQNGLQNLVLETGAIIPSGYANPYSLLTNTVSNAAITSNTTWSGVNYEINGSIVVETGATLNIVSSLLRFNDNDGRVIIKPGGKLILNGSTLQSSHSCNDTWQGIEVWGNSSAHQYMVNNNYLQGYLEMKNGATIENAKCAVQLWRPNYISTTGGIIHATDAVFRNNATSLIALNYNNYNPNTGHDMDYNSYFTDCEFVVDGNYLGNETFYTHVELGYNRGIDFTVCDFSVSSSANGVSANNAGITAYSAGFGVKSSCMDPNTYPCPTNSIKGCTFTGFNTGILSINEGNNTNTLSIKDAVFTNNHTGIHALNIGYAAIVGNEFNIGCGTDCTYGVYIDGATSFCIEENLFKPATFIKCTRYGVGVFNSPSINDIYLNTFNNLTYGNLSYGVNYNVNGGLTYSCNENSGNKIDFCVLKDNGFGMPKPIQGSSTSPAGNTFGGSQYHIYNDGDLLMDYHYNSSATGQTPNSSKLYRVNAYPTTYSNSCASHYGGGGVLKSPEEKAALAEIYKTSQDNHERYLAAGDIIRSNLNDSVANPTELRQWLANMNEIASDRMIVASYIHEGDFTNAFAIANTLPNKYNLQGDELSDHSDYMTLLNLYRALYNSNRTVRELTESEKETVANIAENGHGASKLMATGIIMETSDRTAVSYICPALSREDGDRSKDNSDDNSYDKTSELFVGLSPIPASTWVSVDYKLPAYYAKATMTIMSSYGVKIMDIELSGDKGTTTVDLRDLSSGVYSYIVRCGDKILTGKLVVTK